MANANQVRSARRKIYLTAKRGNDLMVLALSALKQLFGGHPDFARMGCRGLNDEQRGHLRVQRLSKLNANPRRMERNWTTIDRDQYEVDPIGWTGIDWI